MKKILLFTLGLMFVSVNTYATQVPDTGQTTCYDDAYEIVCPRAGEEFNGQDAQYNTTNQQIYTDLGNAVVRDNVTRLEWQQVTAPGTYTWQAAINYCNNLTLGGHGDWRLPTIKELATLVDSSISYPGPTINTTYFSDTGSEHYWSSTTFADDTKYAWQLYFDFGNVNNGSKESVNYVRAVRSAETEVQGGFVDNGDGTVTSLSTGLMWQQATVPDTYIWQDALAYCEGSNLAGYGDWRLPNRNELQSIVDYSRNGPSVNTAFFPGTATSDFWSSTTYVGNKRYVWAQSFNNGNQGNVIKSDSHYVRSVRSGQCGISGDSDLDAVCDDGDASGTVGDNYCTGGTKILCDDNCPDDPNPDQADADNNGRGDICDNKVSTGEEGGPCYGNGQCNSGLICVNDICKSETLAMGKAIILAGGGPYTGNNLWGATQLVTQYAHKILSYQGFNNDSIYFLASGMDIDLDGNDILDDIDGDATNANLEYAIKTWAADAGNVLIFITDHGGEEYFRMSKTEVLYAEDLDSWIDELQQTVSGTVIIIYDACESGSFVPKLTPPAGKDRIIITSSSEAEEAFFQSSGSISFSFYFWGHVLTGASLYDSFLLARNAMDELQTPYIDDNGNGTPNEENVDGALANNYKVGAGLNAAADFPTIGSICPDQNLTGNTSATIWVDDILPPNNILRVWAVMIPPDFVSEDTSVPVTDLSSFELTNSSGNRYEGTYSGFDVPGTYRVYVYAKDVAGNMAIPLSVDVIQTIGTVCPVVRVLGGTNQKTDMLRSFRDDVLKKSAKGRKLVDLYYKHSFELLMIMAFNPEIMIRSQELLNCMVPDIEEMIENRKVGFVDDSEEIDELLDLILENAGFKLRNEIVEIKNDFVNRK